MDTQKSFNTKTYRMNSKLEKILKDSEKDMAERTKSILQEMKLQAANASEDVRQHINKLATN